MKIRILALLALPITVLATGAAQARTATSSAEPELLTGYAPHGVLLAANDSRAGSEGALYYGDLIKPLPFSMPADLPRDVPVQGSRQGGVTGLPMLYELMRDENEPEMEHPRRGAESRGHSLHHGHGRIDLGDGQETGDDSGATTPVPLPASLPLLASLLGLLAAAAAWRRRAPA
jgi:hypothetical protein